MGDPSNPPPVAFMAGLEHMRRGSFVQAAAEFEEALAGKPDFAPACYNLGVVFTALGKWEEANRVVTRYVSFAPRDPFGHLLLGVVQRERKKYEKAVECFMRALRLDGTKALACNQLGKTMLLQGNVHQARIWFEKSLRIKPNSLHALCNLGEIHERQGRLTDALDLYQKALLWIEPPRNLGIYLRVGVLFIKLEFWEKARQVLTRVAELARAGRFQRDDGNPIQASRRGAELAGIHFNLGWVLNHLKRHEEALDALRRAAELLPLDPRTQFQLGWTLQKLRRPREAIPPLTQAVRLAPNFAEARYHLGLSLLASGDGHGAFQQYKALQGLNRHYAGQLLELLDS